MESQTELERQLSGSIADQRAAVRQLAGMEQDGRWAASKLVEFCGSEDQELRDWSVAALEQLGPPPESELQRLTELAASPQELVAYWAWTLVGRLGADAQPALAILSKLATATKSDVVQRRADWAVNKIANR